MFAAAKSDRCLPSDRPLVHLPDHDLSLTIQKSYAELKPLDEFEAFYDKRITRVRVASRVRREGDRVRFEIAPIKTFYRSNPASVCFVAAYPVNVFVHHTPPRERRLRATPQSDRLRELAMEALTQHLQTRRQIGDTVRRSGMFASPKLLEDVLRSSPEDVVRRRVIGVQYLYRLPIAFSVGMPVVENFRSPSQRYGWVDVMQFSRQHGAEYPVCKWLDGTRSFSSDDMLEIATDPKMLNRIEQAKAICQGQCPEGFIELPYFLLKQFQRNTRDRHALLQIAKLIGVVRADQEDLKGLWQTRSLVKDFLDRYYPEILEVHP